MTPALDRIYPGDNLATMRTWPDAFVHTCVTSPPYFGLRDYGTATWEGGDAACAHSVGGQVADGKAPGAITSGVRPGVDASKCRKCGAKRIDHQIGLEATPEAYVARLVEVFREVKRILRDDGTLWMNLGDSYCNTDKWGGGGNVGKNTVAPDGSVPSWTADRQKRPHIPGIKPKDLIGIPWMVAFALRADGWYLRSDIIWSKPNVMPESVVDRPTKAHEYIFLLSKNGKYYYDQDAILEDCSPNTHARVSQDVERQIGSARANGGGKTNGNMKAVVRSPKALKNSPGSKQNENFAAHVCLKVEKRNKRTVWTVPPMPFKEAHFATFPPDLITPCVLAGSPAGGLVLDPFMGAGTTALVAAQYGRRFIGCELNPEYKAIADKRVANEVAQEKLL